MMKMVCQSFFTDAPSVCFDMEILKNVFISEFLHSSFFILHFSLYLCMPKSKKICI